MPLHAVQSMTMARVSGRVVRIAERQLAQQVVGGGVVGLSKVAEPAGHRAERDGGAEGHVADRLHRG